LHLGGWHVGPSNPIQAASKSRARRPQACEAMLTAYWTPFFAWAEMLEDPIDWNAIKPKEPA